MALYTEILDIGINEAKYFTGKKGKVYLGFGVDPPATASKKPASKIQLQGASARVQRQFAKFSGGGAMAAATATWVVTGTPTAETIAELTLDMTVNGINRRVRFQVVIQSGDTTTNVAEDMEALLAAANNGDATPANAFIRGLGPNDTTAQLKTAMENLFGTTEASAFANTANSLLLTLGTTGTDGNNTVIGAAMINSKPSPIVGATSTGAPNIAGFQEFADFDGFNFQNPKSSVNYVSTNTGKQTTLPTTDAVSAAVAYFYNVRPEVLVAAQAALGQSSDTGYELLLPGGAASANVTSGARVIFSFENDSGGFDFIDLYKCYLFNLNLNYKTDAIDPIQVQIEAQPFASRAGDPYGYLAFGV